MGNIHTVGPNESLVVSGGCCGSAKKTFVVGGWAWAWWLLSDVQTISLETMTLQPRCEDVETSEGVPITVTCIAQCKIMNEKELLTIACEQFLGKTVAHIRSVILQTLEGHLRAILGTMSVEEVYRERDQFASLIREVATPDVGRMGIEILSFTIKDVYDNVEYLAALGKARIAEVKRNAAIGIANAERDAGIKESEYDRSAMDIKYSADTKIEDASRSYLTQKAQYDTEVNTQKAEACLAYDLQSTRLQQQIALENKKIDLIERSKLIKIQEKEKDLTEKRLEADVRLEADAKAFEINELAIANRTLKLAEAEAESQSKRLVGKAQADAILAMGRAEAEQLRMNADAYKQFNDAAILAITLETLPKIACEVAAPLTKTNEIVLLSGETGNLSQVVSQVPPMVQAITGYELAKMLSLKDKPTINAQ